MNQQNANDDSQPKRIRLTAKNINRQLETAKAGTLVHWIGSKRCKRKDSGKDVRKEGNVTNLAVAGYVENVSCLGCRKEYYAQFRNKK